MNGIRNFWIRIDEKSGVIVPCFKGKADKIAFSRCIPNSHLIQSQTPSGFTHIKSEIANRLIETKPEDFKDATPNQGLIHSEFTIKIK